MNANRIPPSLPVHAMKTYRVVSPLATHFRDATCEQAECASLEHGWRTIVDEGTDLGARQAHYIRAVSGRKFVEVADPDGRTSFLFEAGQTCFAQHKVPLDRPELYVVDGGDWRGNPRGERYVHSGPDAWVDDLATHTQRFTDLQAQG